MCVCVEECVCVCVLLTIEAVEARPHKLVVVCDLVDHSAQTAYTVLHHLQGEIT